jgi:hypothetical protein
MRHLRFLLALVTGVAADPKKWKNPSTVVFT